MSLSYSKIGEADIDAIAALTERYLTRGDYIRKSILEAFARHNYYGVKAEDAGQMAGFLTFKRGVDFTAPHPGLELKIKAIVGDFAVFNIDSAFVNPERRRAGIGGELMRRAVSMIRRLGGRYLLWEFWIYPDGKIPALHLPDSHLKILFDQRLERFYKDFPRLGMSCPLCGENCQCGALVRLFSLNG